MVIFFFYIMCFSVIGVVGYQFKYWLFILWSFFVLIFFGKIFGLLPYVYGVTTKIYFVLFFSLWGWATIVFSSFLSKIFSFVAHFCPAGAPSALGGFLRLVEVVRVGIRPGTLTLRLVANMTTGHILIGLVTLRACNLFFKKIFLGLIVMVFLGLYLLFEIAIRFIQGQVYLMLLKRYSLEHLWSLNFYFLLNKDLFFVFFIFSFVFLFFSFI